MVIEAIAVGEYEAEEPTEEELAELDRLRVRLTPAATRAFIARAKRVVARRPPAVPAVRPAAGPGRAPVPAPQRLPPVARPLSGAAAARGCAPERCRADQAAAAADRRRRSSSRAGCVDASNTTLRAFVTLDDVSARCVYKPIRGERPLWDFPDGTLAGREVAAYEVSAATGWDVVPPTVLRDGPLGRGRLPALGGRAGRVRRRWSASCRADELPDGWLTVAAAARRRRRPYLLAHADDAGAGPDGAVRRGGQQRRPQGRPRAARAADGHLYGVDHGVCFHVEEKLRTVLWGWVGRPVPRAGPGRARRRCGRTLGGPLGERLRELVSRGGDRRRRRPGWIGCWPRASFRRRRPGWPAVPWPPI